jgi:outer membrane protein OmpA-like peptidoglycan-associated protein
MDLFQDVDGCPDNDNDGDGIPDEKDKCPNDKETFNDYQDEDGCPDKKLAELKTEARKIEILERIHFKFMSAEIQPDSYPLLDQVVQILKDNPHVKLVQVEGHTDKTGPYDLNMQLSLNRAQAVVDYIVGKGIDKQRLKAVGYGYSRRIDYRSGPEANYNNRRVEFNVLEIDLPPGTQVPEEEK